MVPKVKVLVAQSPKPIMEGESQLLKVVTYIALHACMHVCACTCVCVCVCVCAHIYEPNKFLLPVVIR